MKLWVDGSGLEDTGDDATASFQEPAGAMADQIVAAHAAGWQVAAHAMGDAAVDLVLDALARARAAHPRAGLRHRIEHCAVVRPDQVPRLVDLGITSVPQPVFLPEFGDVLAHVFGPARTAWPFRVQSLLAAGVPVAASSDRPVADGAPLRGIQAMVERTTGQGRPYGPDERVAADVALECYTLAGARAANQEGWSGSLTPGKVADLTVLGGDPTGVEAGAIGTIEVLATMVDGHIAHDPGRRLGDGA